MTTTYFAKLSLKEKIDLLSDDATYLMSRQNFLYNIFLYGVRDLYVEVWYLRKTNQLQDIEVITSNKAMELYLNKMNLEFV